MVNTLVDVTPANSPYPVTALYSAAQHRFMRVTPTGITDSCCDVGGPEAFPTAWDWEKYRVIYP